MTRVWNEKNLNAINAQLEEGEQLTQLPERTVNEDGSVSFGNVSSKVLELMATNTCANWHPQYARLEYEEDGSVKAATDIPTGYRYGDTMYIAPYATKVSIDVLNGQEKTLDQTAQYVYSLEQGQAVVDYQIDPELVLGFNAQGSETGDIVKTSVTMTQTLPKGLDLINGSVYWGGKYTPAAIGYQGTVTGGIPLENGSTVTYTHTVNGKTYDVKLTYTSAFDPVTGETTLTFRFDDVPLLQSELDLNALADKMYISASIDSGFGTGDIWQLTTSAQIQGAQEHQTIDLVNGNRAVQAITVQQSKAEAISSNVSPYFREINALCDWNVVYSNNANSDSKKALLFTTLPDNAEYTFDVWKLDMEKAGITSADEVKLYYTTVEQTGKDASSYTADEIAQSSDWQALTLKVADGFLVPENISAASGAKAWALTGTLQGGKSFSVNHGITPPESTPGQTYQAISSFRTKSETALATYVSVCIAGRKISGLAWYDRNQNGIREDGEKLISGAQVWLYRKQDNEYAPITQDLSGNAYGMVYTDNDGMYSFTALPDGDYYVLFNGDALREYSGVSAVNAGNDDSIDNDAAAASEGYRTIQRVVLPTIDAINANAALLGNDYQVVQNHLDIGLIKSGALRVTKIVDGAVRPQSESDQAFTFHLAVQLDDAAYTGDLSSTISGAPLKAGADGTYSFTLTGGQTILISDLPADATYSLSEDADVDADGVTRYITAHQAKDGTITSGSTVEATFTNTYVEDIQVVPRGTKHLSGRKFIEGDTFTFNMKAITPNAPIPDKTAVTITPVTGESRAFAFGAINYTLADAGKNYIYEVWEESGSLGGMAYDKTIYTMTVSIVINHDDKLQANVSLKTAAQENAAALDFTNSYSAKPVKASIPVKKVLEVPAGLTCGDITGKFTFTLSAKVGVPMPETTRYTNPDKDGGVVTFGEIDSPSPELTSTRSPKVVLQTA